MPVAVTCLPTPACDWRWTDGRLERIRSLGMRPIAGLLHHGSGPRYTNLLESGFAVFRHYTPVPVESDHGPRLQNPNGDVSVPAGYGLPTKEFHPAIECRTTQQ